MGFTMEQAYACVQWKLIKRAGILKRERLLSCLLAEAMFRNVVKDSFLTPSLYPLTYLNKLNQSFEIVLCILAY